MPGQSLIIVGAVVLDWGIAFVLWRGATRLLRRPISPRLSDVMPWTLLQLFILVGLLATGALADARLSALVLTAIPLAVVAAFFAVPVALFKARGARKIEWRICLDHTYATLAVWAFVFVLGVVL